MYPQYQQNQQPFYQNQNQGQYPIGGFNYAFNQQQKPIQLTQTLNQNEIDTLRKQNAGGINFNITEMDIMNGSCCHREGDHFTLRDNGDGTVTCTICGKTFTPLDPSMITSDQVKDIVYDFGDIIESIKMYSTMPRESARAIFGNICPILEKIPVIYDLAVKTMNAIGNPNVVNPNSNNMNGFNALSGLMGGMMPMGQPYYQQPMGYQQPMPNVGMMQQPGYFQQPVQQPPMGYQQPMGGFPGQMQYATNMPQQQGAPVGVVETQEVQAPGPAAQPVKAKVPASKKTFNA